MRFKDFAQQLLLENPDNIYDRQFKPRTFGFHKDYIAYFPTEWEPTHHDLLVLCKKKFFPDIDISKFYLSPGSAKDFKDIGTPDKFLLMYLEDSDTAFTDRDKIAYELPGSILGRITLNRTLISFWNRLVDFGPKEKEQVFKIFELYNKKPEDYTYEFLEAIDSYKTVRVPYEEFLGHVKIDSNEKRERMDTSHIVHLAPAEKKGAIMKAQGIKPKAPLGAAQRFAMGESFREFFQQVITEKNYSYNIPKDKELLLYDFYMVTYLNALEKEGKFEPGTKADAMGQTVETPTHSMGVRDSTLSSFKYIKDQILDSNKVNMLDESLFSICCELRHVFANNTVERIKQIFGPEIEKVVAQYYINYKRNINGNHIDYKANDTVKSIINDRERAKDKKYNVKKIEGTNEEYLYSYKAAKKTIQQLNMSDAEFVDICKKLFISAEWAPSYGGKAWAGICKAYATLDESKNEFQKIFAIDNMYHQQHNTGSVFTKLKTYLKGNSHDWLLRALDFKADVKENWQRIAKIKELLDRDYPGKGLRGIDRMYIELLKASGDKTYEQYFQVTKPSKKEEPASDNTDKSWKDNFKEYKNNKTKYLEVIKKIFKDHQNEFNDFGMIAIGPGNFTDPIKSALGIDESDLYWYDSPLKKMRTGSVGSNPDYIYYINVPTFQSLFGHNEYAKLLHDQQYEKEKPKKEELSPALKQEFITRAVNEIVRLKDDKDQTGFDQMLEHDLVPIGNGNTAKPLKKLLGLGEQDRMIYFDVDIKKFNFSPGNEGSMLECEYFIDKAVWIKIFGQEAYDNLPIYSDHTASTNQSKQESNTELSPQEKHKFLYDIQTIVHEIESSNTNMFAKMLEKHYIPVGYGTTPDLKNLLKLKNNKTLSLYDSSDGTFDDGFDGQMKSCVYFLSANDWIEVFGKDAYDVILKDIFPPNTKKPLPINSSETTYKYDDYNAGYDDHFPIPHYESFKFKDFFIQHYS